jgi:hypothetical protein
MAHRKVYNNTMDNDEKLDYYLEIGAVEVAGIQEDGEFLYEITAKAKDVAPELWESHIEYIDNTILDLYEKGLVEIEYNENLEASISVSEEAKSILRSYGMYEDD